MLPEDFLDLLIEQARKQADHYEKTGEVLEFTIPQHDIELTVDPNDPPEVRRRVILFRAKMQEWREIGRRNEAARQYAQMICIDNVAAMFENMM